MTLHEQDTKKITARNKLIIRGATTHFKAPYSRAILDYCRRKKITYIVVSTGMAAQGLRTYLGEFRQAGDAAVEQIQPFQGDGDSLIASLCNGGKSADDIKAAFANLAAVVRNIRKTKGRVLVLCQVGRNRSFTTAFVYYLVYHGVGKSITQNVSDFKQWHGVSFDKAVQSDGSQRLDEKQPDLPWMQDLCHIFESNGVVTQARIDMFMGRSGAGKSGKSVKSGQSRRGKVLKRSRSRSRSRGRHL